MAYVGWVLFVLIGWLYISAQRLNHRKRMNLRAYIVYLLLEDKVRDDHKMKFRDWIRNTKTGSAIDLSTKAQWAVEEFADRFSEVSIQGAHSFLWNYEDNRESRGAAGQNQ